MVTWLSPQTGFAHSCNALDSFAFNSDGMRSRKITNIDKIHMLQNTLNEVIKHIENRSIELEVLAHSEYGLTDYGKGKLNAYSDILTKLKTPKP